MRSTDVFAASEKAGFQCWPSVHEMNWVALKGNGEIRVTIEVPDGYESMPQLEGPLSASQLPFLHMQADDLSILGNRFTLTWKESDCETFDPANRWLICSRPGRSSVAGVNVLTVASFKTTEENPNGQYVQHKMRLTLEREGNTYFVTFVFPEKSCRAL
jgi:hypothetical protein